MKHNHVPTVNVSSHRVTCSDKMWARYRALTEAEPPWMINSRVPSHITGRELLILAVGKGDPAAQCREGQTSQVILIIDVHRLLIELISACFTCLWQLCVNLRRMAHLSLFSSDLCVIIEMSRIFKIKRLILKTLNVIWNVILLKCPNMSDILMKPIKKSIITVETMDTRILSCWQWKKIQNCNNNNSNNDKKKLLSNPGHSPCCFWLRERTQQRAKSLSTPNKCTVLSQIFPAEPQSCTCLFAHCCCCDVSVPGLCRLWPAVCVGVLIHAGLRETGRTFCTAKFKPDLRFITTDSKDQNEQMFISLIILYINYTAFSEGSLFFCWSLMVNWQWL